MENQSVKSQLFRINFSTGKLESVDTTPDDPKNHLEIGTVLFLNGYGDSKYAITENLGINENFSNYGARYNAIDLEDYSRQFCQAHELLYLSQKKDNRIQIYITEEKVGLDIIQDLIIKAKLKDEADIKEAEEIKIAEKKEREQLKETYKNLELLAESKKTHWALAAANIRKELKLKFPGVKFRVRSESYSMGDSVDVDGPSDIRDEAEKIINKYQYGDFNSMEDIYENNNTQFCALFGSAKYVFYN